MSLRRNDYQQRKEAVLGIVVSQYVKTVTPVSSSFIAQEYLPDFSSATIRNILAELESDGYLTHPHRSAGRIPTQEGYRFYVDYLMQEIKLLEEEQFRIKREYDRDIRDLEQLLEKTSQVLSDLTHYTSMISIDGCQGRLICRWARIMWWGIRIIRIFKRSGISYWPWRKKSGSWRS